VGPGRGPPGPVVLSSGQCLILPHGGAAVVCGRTVLCRPGPSARPVRTGAPTRPATPAYESATGGNTLVEPPWTPARPGEPTRSEATTSEQVRNSPYLTDCVLTVGHRATRRSTGGGRRAATPPVTDHCEGDCPAADGGTVRRAPYDAIGGRASGEDPRRGTRTRMVRLADLWSSWVSRRDGAPGRDVAGRPGLVRRVHGGAQGRPAAVEVGPVQAVLAVGASGRDVVGAWGNS
jgi:hypothetical protein